ncbi:MAG: EI24 domain-containing protein [Bacteroidales bacterium]
MGFFEGISESLYSFLKSIPFTFRHFSIFFIVPVLLFIALFLLFNFLGNSVYDIVSNKLYTYIGVQHDSSWFFSIISILLRGLLFVLFKLIFFFVFFFFSGYVILIILSPVLSYLSEKTEKIVKNKDYPFSFKIWFKQIGRSILLSVRNLFIQLILTFIVLILSFIPIIGWMVSPFAAPFICIFNAYYLGFSFLDYSFERKGLNISQSVSLVRKNKGLAVGFGMLFYLVYLIPIVGNFLAPFMAIFVVVAATLSAEKIL